MSAGQAQGGRIARLRESLLGPAAVKGGVAFLAIGLIDAIGTGMYLAGSALFFTTVVGLTAAQVGIGLSIAGVLGLAAQPVIGWLADRWTPRRLLAFLNIYRAVGFTAYVFADDFLSFLLIAAFLGVGEQAVFPIYQALAEQMAGADGRVAMMARMRVVFNVGFTLGGLLASLAIAVGTRAAFSAIVLGNAASFVLAALLLSRLTLNQPATPGEPKSRKSPLRLVALRDLRYVAVSAANGVLVLHMALLGIGVPLWVSEHTSAPKALVGLLLVVNTVLAVVFQVRASAGTENVAGGIRAMHKAAVALVGSCALFALAGYDLPVAAVVALLVLGLVLLTAGELYQSAGGWGLSYSLAPDRSRAEYLATFNLGTSAQFVLGPTIVTVGVIGTGTTGWVVLGIVFVLAGIAVGPLARAAEKRPALRTGAQPDPAAAPAG
ncbi:MFS transporter [Streptomyces xanthophaeus]|uniref:MFS transporter n=1 Tax=Streptomyces xanthophaeus TaxID=67385 RepID=UPI000690596B|nr:MFS transporter [Streptomyces xanthophaeus]WST22519.1 MFS transporter [Streptomyces xanthophaeus]WST62505.1 MFS transporter [Streptomyces xanthophaeus]